MGWSGVTARVSAVVFAVVGVVLAAAAFSSWYGEAQEGYSVDDDGPLAAALSGDDDDRIVVADVIDDDCAELVLIAAGTPTETYEPVVGNADSDVDVRTDRVLAVVFDELGGRVHAEHVPVSTGLVVADDVRRLDCNRPWRLGSLRR